MTIRWLLVVVGALLAIDSVHVSADTHAPSAQTMTLSCNGQPLTFVSPGFHALAGQEVNSTRVGVVLLITFDGEVVYRSRAVQHMPAGLLTTCSDGPLVFTFVAPPLT